MKPIQRLLGVGLLLLAASSAPAQADSASQSPDALRVLKSMSDFIDSQDAFRISGQSSSDAWLQTDLLVSNTAEIQLAYREPGSMQFSRLSDSATDVLNIDQGQLLYFASATGYYATAQAPNGIGQALEFAFEELGIDLPLMDLVRTNAFDRMVDEGDSVLHVTDRARVDGVKCDQVVIRTPELDIQLWVQQGEQPLPRRVVLTDRWLQGSPRFVANMEWDLSPEFDRHTFLYAPPDGAEKIEFLRATDE
jgi:hypothetical protein